MYIPSSHDQLDSIDTLKKHGHIDPDLSNRAHFAGKGGVVGRGAKPSPASPHATLQPIPQSPRSSITFCFSFPKLASLSVLWRRCARPQLRYKLLDKPTSCSFSASSFVGNQAHFRNTRQLLRPQTGTRSARNRLSEIRNQLRFCSCESNGSSFAIMASDRDILPSWSACPFNNQAS